MDKDTQTEAGRQTKTQTEGRDTHRQTEAARQTDVYLLLSSSWYVGHVGLRSTFTRHIRHIDLLSRNLHLWYQQQNSSRYHQSVNFSFSKIAIRNNPLDKPCRLKSKRSRKSSACCGRYASWARPVLRSKRWYKCQIKSYYVQEISFKFRPNEFSKQIGCNNQFIMLRFVCLFRDPASFRA